MMFNKKNRLPCLAFKALIKTADWATLPTGVPQETATLPDSGRGSCSARS